MNFSSAGFISYLLAFSWGLCILIALGGWGALINRMLLPPERLDWAQKATLGLALTVCFGGVLNLTGTISQTFIFCYVALGFTYGLVELFQHRALLKRSLAQLRQLRERPILLVGLIIVALLLCIRYAGSVHAMSFNPLDDDQAYLVFPYKMLQTGSMGPDPYSERRLVASLGGQSFLDSIILSLLPTENVKITEEGYAVVLTVAGLIGYLKDKRVSLGNTLTVLFLALFIHPPSVNVTALIVPIPLFISMFRFLDGKHLKNKTIFSNATILASLGAATCSLKNNLIAPVGCLLLTSYCFYALNSPENRRKPIYEGVITFGLLVLFLLPWMISLKLSSGTFLYPFLGKGYHGSSYGNYVPYYAVTSLRAIVRIFISRVNVFLYFILIPSWICFKNQILWQENDERKSLLSLIISGILGTLIIRVGTSQVSAERHTFPFLLTVLLILIAIVLDLSSRQQQGDLPRSHSRFVALSIIGLALGYGLISFLSMYRDSLNAIQLGLQKVPIIPETRVVQYQKMQQSIPENASIITRLEKPFLMNFQRNQVFICDWPGGASPPPGMPIHQGSEPLAQYFLSQSIRYVAYSYAQEAAYSRAGNPLQSDTSLWNIAVHDRTFDFQDNLKVLGKTRQRIYDDGDIWTIDLQKKAKETN